MIWQQQHAAAGGVDPATLFEAFAALGRAFGELIDIVAETGRRMVAAVQDAWRLVLDTRKQVEAASRRPGRIRDRGTWPARAVAPVGPRRQMLRVFQRRG